MGRFRKNLTATTALVAAAMLALPTAAEACANSSIVISTAGAAAQTLNCGGDTLTVNSGASITASSQPVTVNLGSSITNTGTIKATSYSDIYLSGTAAMSSITNSGTISLTNNAASASNAAIYISSGASVSNALTNSGTIKSDMTQSGSTAALKGYGLYMTGGTIKDLDNQSGSTLSAKAVSQSAATVQATAAGVYLDNNAGITGAVTNAGTISGDASVTNATLYLHAYGYGVAALNSSSIASITNNGTISGSIEGSKSPSLSSVSAAGVYLNNATISGALTNSGTIKASLSVPSIYGTVKGNTIADTAVTGLKLTNGSSINSVNNNGGTIEATVSIVPTVSAANATPSSATKVAVFAAGMALHGSTVTNAITNSGTIKATATVTAKSISYDWAMGIDATGTSNIGSITNSGTISATAKGTATATGATTTNYASASGMYLNGVTFSGGITNSGTISGTVTGVVAKGGKITGYVRGANIVSATSLTALTNKSSGVISAAANLTAQSGTAVATAWGVSLESGIGSIDNAGTIEGTATLKTTSLNKAKGIVYGADIWNGGSMTGGFTNSGTIEGIVTAGASATGSNTGTAYGLSVDGGTVTGALTNSGTIKAKVDAGSTGISEKAYGLYLNNATLGGGFTNTGTVEGTVAHTWGTGYGIYINGGGGTITNTGTIKGSTDAIYMTGLSSATNIDINGGTVSGGIVDAGWTGGHSTLTLGTNLTTSGNITVSNLAINSGDTLTISAGNAVKLNTMTAPPAGTLALAVNGTGAGNFGSLTVSGGPVNIANTGSITVAVGSSSSGLAAGHMMVVTGTGQTEVNGAAQSVNVATVSGSSYMWNFALQDGTTSTFGTNNQLYLVVTQSHTISGSATNSLTSGVAAALQSQINSANPIIQSMISAVNAAPNQTAVNNLLQTYQTIVGGGAAMAAFGVGSSTSDQFGNREDALLDGTGNTTGMAAGDFSHGVHM